MSLTELRRKIEKIPKVNPESIISRLVPAKNFPFNCSIKIQVYLEFKYKDKIYTLISNCHSDPDYLIKEIKNMIKNPNSHLNNLKIMEKKIIHKQNLKRKSNDKIPKNNKWMENSILAFY